MNYDRKADWVQLAQELFRTVCEYGNGISGSVTHGG